VTTEPRRQHRSAILGNALGVLRDAAVPLLVAFVAGVGTSDRSAESALAYAAFGAAVAIATGYRQWSTTTYWVGPDGVHLRSGMFSTSETVIPRARIQAIDTSQNPLQRCFGTLSVQVQAAGGGAAAEIVLGAVTPGDARLLRASVGLPEPASAVERLTLGLSGLLVVALTAPQFGVLLPVVAAAGTLGDELFFAGLRRGWYESLPLGPGLVRGALLVALVAWVLSMVASVIAFAGFTVERDGERLRIRRGLAQRRVASLPLARVHAVSVVEGVLRQPLGLVSLRLETAGYRSEPAAAQTLFPLLRRCDVEHVLARFVPELAGALEPLSPLPRRALGAYVLPVALAGSLAVAVCAWLRPELWPPAAALTLLAVAHGVAGHRAAGWRVADGRVLVRHRRLARRTLVARVARLQEHSLMQTPLQRRRRLAGVELAVASGRRARVPQLDAEVARGLFSVLAAGASGPSRTVAGSRGEPSAAAAGHATGASAPMNLA
jgi:putative membrane protein